MNPMEELHRLHDGKHVCTTGDGRGWFMWGAKEMCPTAAAIALLDVAAPAPEGER